LRHTQLKNLRASSSNLIPSIEQFESQIQALDDDSNFYKELRHLARLLVYGATCRTSQATLFTQRTSFLPFPLWQQTLFAKAFW